MSSHGFSVFILALLTVLIFFPQTFATLSPIPGFMQWLLSKLASQSKLAEAEDVSLSSVDSSGSAFWENILEPEEEKALMDLSE